MNTGGVLWYRKKMGFAYAIVANLLSALAVLIPGV